MLSGHRARDGRAVRATVLGIVIGLWPASVFAQAAPFAQSSPFGQTGTTLIAPVLPEGFDRGRNVSVSERPRPDYDALGIPVGAFNVFPKIGVALGASSNIYLTDHNKTSAGFLDVTPSFKVDSDWSRHQLSFGGSSDLERYFGESRRNENNWNLGSLLRLDVGNELSVTAEGQIARQFETPFSGEISSSLAVLSNYLRGFASLRGQYKAGQTRAILAVDRTGFSFSDIEQSDGTRINQSYRDRDINRVTGQAEFAFTPSVSAYAQLTYSDIDYRHDLPGGIANRDSDGFRIIGGVNFDLAGLARGSVGVGYVRRNYHAAIYDDVSGFSAEAKIEYFPSELTTFTLLVRRVVEDSSVSTTNAFFDNRFSLRVDHELLRNLLLNATGEYARQDYIASPLRANVYRGAGGARFLLSRKVEIDATVSYTGQSAHGGVLGQRFDEYRGQVGVVLQI